MLHMVHLGLFEAGDGGRIYCMKMLKRMDTSMTSNYQMRKNIAIAKQNHDGVMTESCQNHDGVMRERKKERKKEGGESKRFTAPSVDDVAEYVKQKGYNIDAEQFVAHYNARGWKLNRGQAMKCWKSACTTWQKNAKRFGGPDDKKMRYI